MNHLAAKGIDKEWIVEGPGDPLLRNGSMSPEDAVLVYERLALCRLPCERPTGDDMKVAISGKGGVGKSTLAAALALLLAERGRKVLALDADPDANLATALGIPAAAQEAIVPIARQAALIEERTGAKVRQYGQIFKLNPEVSDLADRFAFHHRGVALLVLGAVQRGGSAVPVRKTSSSGPRDGSRPLS
jgi:hypothetical protein